MINIDCWCVCVCVCFPSDHYASVVGERDQLLQQKTEAQHSYLKNMDRGKEDNKKVRERERERETDFFYCYRSIQLLRICPRQ